MGVYVTLVPGLEDTSGPECIHTCVYTVWLFTQVWECWSQRLQEPGTYTDTCIPKSSVFEAWGGALTCKCKPRLHGCEPP